MELPANHPIFGGHFPGRPIVPGAMLLDWAWREAALRLAVCEVRLCFRQVKFLAPLLPGERSVLTIDGGDGRRAFRIERDGAAIATGLIEIADE